MRGETAAEDIGSAAAGLARFTAVDSVATDTIPFNRADVTGRELQYVEAVVRREQMESDGAFTGRAAALIAAITSSPCALVVNSCTGALEMTGLLLDLAPGDEVIVPSFAFVSVANFVALRGATPVFVDCRADTLNLDETLVESAVTGRTKAIVVLHYGGVAAEMDAIRAIADRYGLAIVEDNAHGLGGTYRDRPLGSIGTLAALSFHVTKNVQCGEGGALLVNDLSLLERAEVVREKGTDRRRFVRGAVDRYRWVDLGSSYVASELQSAFLTAQLESFSRIQARRHEVWSAYHERLVEWALERGVAQPTVPEGCAHAAHLYHLLMPDRQLRDRLLRHVAERGVRCAFHYQPLHDSPAGRRFGRMAAGGCPVTERAAGRLVRLPLYPGLRGGEIDRVVDAVTSFEIAR
jgi:dTDP-4-amino-4,6-dideoxygalactose transaminase